MFTVDPSTSAMVTKFSGRTADGVGSGLQSEATQSNNTSDKKETFLIMFYSALNFKYQCKPSDAGSWSYCKLIVESVIDNIL